MDNPIVVNEEQIPLVQDEDYDNYGTPNISRVDETSFTELNTTEASVVLSSVNDVSSTLLIFGVP